MNLSFRNQAEQPAC